MTASSSAQGPVSGPAYQVVMPKLGLTMTEATIVEWRKQDGEWVEKGEPLFVLESDKASLEIEAPAGGVLHILIPAGNKVPVNEPIALLGGPGASAGSQAGPDATHAPRPSSPAQGLVWRQFPAQDSVSGPFYRASPKARALARRLGLKLEGIAGTGARGMIVVADVDRVAALNPVSEPLAASGRGGLPWPSFGSMPLPGLRDITTERGTRWSASWRERPHVTLTSEADATQLVGVRQQAIAELGENVSYDTMLVAVVARALQEHPHVNVRWSAGGVEQLTEVNIGVAVDSKRGLLVPVVRDAPSLRLLQIHRRLRELIERVLDGCSLPDDLTGGTFTIADLGPFEVDAFTPIINPPESAALGVGRVVAKPVAVEGQVVVRHMMALSLSFDHRVLDGAPAARFLQRVKQLIERPMALLF